MTGRLYIQEIDRLNRPPKLVYEKLDSVSHKHKHIIQVMYPYSNQMGEMVRWCIDTFGEDTKRLFISSTVFCFRDEKDANWFLLRWS